MLLKLRVTSLDPNASLEFYSVEVVEGTIHYIIVESTLADDIIESSLLDDMTENESKILLEHSSEKQALKNEFLDTMTMLDEIQRVPVHSGKHIRFMAGVIKRILKLFRYNL
jgi:hypothetical protein